MPITIGPYGSNFKDVISALKCLRALDAGIEVEIRGQKVMLVAFSMCYLGDMPQQQKNSGMKSQKAKCGCRFCYIVSDERGNLNYDTFYQGRYYK